VHVEASDGDALGRLVANSAELIAAAQISSDAFVWKPDNVHFGHENLDKLKQQVLAEAVQNARTRVAALADAAGVKLSNLRQIELGDIQVISPGSKNRYSDDEETPTKDILVDVKVLYNMR
jgi:uncharacterized protein YggE